MSQFIFKNYTFEDDTATFYYEFEDGRSFSERIVFGDSIEHYDTDALDRALRLAHLVIGTSYYKTFPSRSVTHSYALDDWQALFFNRVYQEGLSQFAFENSLSRDELAVFTGGGTSDVATQLYKGSGVLSLQSGGKDSLLTATLLREKNISFTPWYVASGDAYPIVIGELGSEPLVQSTRIIDYASLKQASEDGAMNGHVPVTYIIESLALIQAILLGRSHILVSIGHEGEEEHHVVGDLKITHQWSKTWQAELDFAEYVKRYISPDIHIGSPIRDKSELAVAELFVKHAWERYGDRFSSCNVANYRQGNDNSHLVWCGNCPKCANSFLLFAPFLNSDVLKNVFNGQDLFTKSNLSHTFQGLLGFGDVPKPFECVGEIDELRLAYHKAQARGGYGRLPFEVPESDFNYLQIYPAQKWAVEMLQ